MTKAIIGKEIIVHSVIPPNQNSRIKILKRRQNYLSFSWKSRDRKGEPCKAFINEKITGKRNLQIRMLSIEDFIEHLKKRFKNEYDCEFIIFYENQQEMIKCKKLFGECNSYRTHPVKTSGIHGKNETSIKGDDFHSALCYQDVGYSEEEKLIPT